MAQLRRFLLRLSNVFRPDRAESELARELASHLTLLEEDFQRRGMTPDEARLAARRAFGGVEQTKDLQRDARSFLWLDDARRDLRHAVRLLRRDPLVTLTAALSLAIVVSQFPRYSPAHHHHRQRVRVFAVSSGDEPRWGWSRRRGWEHFRQR
jgi:hypothetical protein